MTKCHLGRFVPCNTKEDVPERLMLVKFCLWNSKGNVPKGLFGGFLPLEQKGECAKKLFGSIPPRPPEDVSEKK